MIEKVYIIIIKYNIISEILHIINDNKFDKNIDIIYKFSI